MDFRQMSAMLSVKVKQQICQEHNRKDEDITFLLDEQYLETLWVKLAREEKAVIRYFLLNKRNDFLSQQELEHCQFPIPAAEFHKGLTLLRRKGIIFTLKKLWGEWTYTIPQELISVFHQILVPYESTWVDTRSIPSYSSYHIIQGVYQVLNYVRFHPLVLTKKGTIQRKDLRVLCNLFGVAKESFSPLKPLNQLLPSYEHHEAIVLEWLNGWNTLSQSGNTLILGDQEGWKQIFSEDGYFQLRKWMSSYLDLDQGLAFFYDLMLSLSPGISYSLQRMLQSMGEFAPLSSIVEEKILIPLSNLGLLKYGYPGDVVWEWKYEMTTQECKVYVQPNFEILVPRVSTLHLKWTIGEFADLVSQEEMWLFKLNRESVQRYFDQGKNSDRLLEQLQSCSAALLPDNIVQTLRQWESEFGRIQFFDFKVMEVNDFDLANQLERIPAITEHIIQRLGDRFFAIRMEKWEEVVAELQRRGYSPKINGTINQGDPPESLKVYKSPENRVEYKVESVFPDLEDAIPGLRQIPRIWIANFQPYHSSTLRNLAQKAIQIGIGLKLQWNDEIVQMNPSSLLNKDGYWILQGTDHKLRTREYRLDDIQKIQVITP
ncbi:MAG TPA: helicase-associated domain-containing protein [Bacillota bacterium]|nr:helicase-associated domain-containing protein [Bacillota bacterium]